MFQTYILDQKVQEKKKYRYISETI
jgi:hypothetical protein